MKARTLTIARWILIMWGGLCLVGVLAIGAIVAYNLGPGNRARTDSATTQDVRFVLNWCGLGDQRIDKVVRSYVSERSGLGDHLDAYAIEISHVDLTELTPITDQPRGGWYRGDQLPKPLDDAVAFVGSWAHEVPWFPGEAELRSSEVYVYSWSIDYRGLEPSAVELIFVRPSDKMVFYFGGKT